MGSFWTNWWRGLLGLVRTKLGKFRRKRRIRLLLMEVVLVIGISIFCSKSSKTTINT